MNLDSLLGKHIVPDPVMRFAVRCVLKNKRKKEKFTAVENHFAYIDGFIENLKKQPIAVYTPDANWQHYELPRLFLKRFWAAG